MQPYDKVKNFWRNSPTQEYQEGLKADQILRQGSTEVQQILDTKLAKRGILHSNEKDILVWGYEEIGTYSTREAYNYHYQGTYSERSSLEHNMGPFHMAENLHLSLAPMS